MVPLLPINRPESDAVSSGNAAQTHMVPLQPMPSRGPSPPNNGIDANQNNQDGANRDVQETGEDDPKDENEDVEVHKQTEEASAGSRTALDKYLGFPSIYAFIFLSLSTAMLITFIVGFAVGCYKGHDYVAMKEIYTVTAGYMFCGFWILITCSLRYCTAESDFYLNLTYVILVYIHGFVFISALCLLQIPSSP